MARFFLMTVLSLVAVLLASLPISAQEADPPDQSVSVTFQLNDAFVQDRVLPGVSVEVRRSSTEEPLATGVTDAQGQYGVDLSTGTYVISYALERYVTIGLSETTIHSDGQVITTSLSPMLEAAEGTESSHSDAAERVQIVLNWGSSESQVRDADSHIRCACKGMMAHVYFAQKRHEGPGHSVDLDVDDVDWGGPETITLHTPLPGTYPYWVHDYSGPPAVLGESDAVVRVLFDNLVVGEYRVSPGNRSRYWRPFAAIEVSADQVPSIIPFTIEEIAAGLQYAEPR